MMGVVKKLGFLFAILTIISLSPVFAALEIDCSIETANSYDDAWELGPDGWVITMQKRHESFSGVPGSLVINGDSNLDRGPGWMWMNISSSPDYPQDGSGNPMPQGQGHTDPDSVYMGYNDRQILDYLHMDQWLTTSDTAAIRNTSYNGIELAVIGDSGDGYALLPGGTRMTAWNGTTYSNWLRGIHTGTPLPIPSYQEMFSAGVTPKAMYAGDTTRRQFRDFEFFFVSLGTNDLRNGLDAYSYGHSCHTAMNFVLDPANCTIPIVSSPSRTSSNYERFAEGIPQLPAVCRVLGIPYMGFDEEGMRRARAWECWVPGEYGYKYTMGDGLHYSGLMVDGYTANPYQDTTVHNALLGEDISGKGANLSNNYALLRGWLLAQKIKEIKAKVIDVTHAAPGTVALTGAAPAHNKVNLSWTGGDRAAYFELHRRKSGGRWQMVSQKISPAASAYTDMNRTAGGVDYEYRIRAVNGFGKGFGDWGTASVKTPDAPALASLKLSQTRGTAAVNGLYTYEVIGTYDDGSTSIINDIAELAFDDNSIAEKLESGSATAVGKSVGSTGLTVKVSGKTASGKITVTPAEDLLPTDDAYSAMDYTGDNGLHGDSENLRVRYSPTYQYSALAYLKFDLNELSRTDFDTVSLNLYLNTGGGSAVNVAGVYGTSDNLLDRWAEEYYSYTFDGGILRNGISSADDPNANIDGGADIGNGEILGSLDTAETGLKTLSNSALKDYCSGPFGLGDGYDADVTFGLLTSNANSVIFNSKEAGSDKPRLSVTYPPIPDDIAALSVAPAYKTDMDSGAAAPPVLSPDTTENDTDHDIVLAFSDANGWSDSVAEVSVNGTPLTETDDYILDGAEGRLTLKTSSVSADSVLHVPGTWLVSVSAGGFTNTEVSQEILTGEPCVSASAVAVSPEPDLNTNSTVTVSLTDSYNNPVSDYVLKYDVTVINDTAATNESYTVNETAYTASSADNTLSATDDSGQARFALSVPETVDEADGISVQIKLADGTNVGDPIIFGGKTPPALNPDTADNHADKDIAVTFADSDNWSAAVTTVKINGAQLTESDWNITDAVLTLKASDAGASPVLHQSGLWTVSVIADGFMKAEVSQTVLPGDAYAPNCTINDDVILVRELIMQTTLTAKDRYGNPVAGYVFKYDTTKWNEDPAHDEIYAIHDADDAKLSDISSSLTDQELPPADSEGRITVGLYTPDAVDWNDGISFQFQLNDGTTNIGNAIEYREIEDGNIEEPPAADRWTAYHALNTPSSCDSSKISTGNGNSNLSGAALLNYDTGADTGADISIVYSGGTLSSYEFQFPLDPAGGDAAIFNDIMTFSRRLAYTNSGSVKGRITFSNLSSSDRYAVALFINRNADKGNTKLTLLDAGASVSAHSAGVSVLSDVTAEVNSDNTAAGCLVKWTGIVPAGDGGTSFSVEISVGSGYMYMPLGIMLEKTGAAAPLPASVRIGDDGLITEGAEDGEIITVTLTGGTFADPLTPGNWSIANQPSGVVIGEVTRLDDTTVIIELSGNAQSDYDTNIEDFTVNCAAAEVDGAASGLSGTEGVIFTALNETDPPVAGEWTAYHALNTPASCDLSKISTGNGNSNLSGADLLNCDTGADTGADISVTYSGGTLSSYEFQFPLDPAGGDAAIFNNIMTFSRRLAYTDNTAVKGRISFSNLSSSAHYAVALFINRSADKGNTKVTLLDAGASVSAHSAGVRVLSDVTAEVNSDNTAAGCLVKWTDIVPAGDGGTSFSLEISVGSGYMYMPLGIILERTGAAAPLPASVRIEDDGLIAEGAEDGEIITVFLNGGTFADPLTPANWTISNQPSGVILGSVTRVDDTTVRLKLSGNAESDYDTNIEDFAVSCAASEVSGSDSDLSAGTGVLFTAVQEVSESSIAIADDGLITEGAENGEIITVFLNGGTFADPLTPANWSISNQPSGVVIGEVARLDDTTVTIRLSGNAESDYDTDIEDFAVSCAAAEVDGAASDLSSTGGVIFTAFVETDPPVTSGWTAYHALNTPLWYDASKISTGNGNSNLSAASLLNYDTGADTGADISIVYSGGTLSSYGFMNDLNAAGGDAVIFNDVMTFSDRLAYTNNASVTGRITFSGLTPSDFYTVALFINRGADKGNTSVTLADTDASVSAHSPGVSVVSDLTAEINSDNTAAGDLVKWTDIVPSADGGNSFSVEISLGCGYMYMPVGIMLQKSSRGGTPPPAFIEIEDDGRITEGEEDGEIITVFLTGGTFADPLTPANWSIANQPSGVVMADVVRIDDITAVVELSGNADADYDTDITDFTVSCAASEVSGSDADLSAGTGVIFTAIQEASEISISIADDGVITEGEEDGEIITVFLTGGVFANPLTPANWSIANQPPGVIIGEVARLDDTTAALELSGNTQADYDTDIEDFTVTCTADEVEDAASGFSANTGVIFTAVVETTVPGAEIWTAYHAMNTPASYDASKISTGNGNSNLSAASLLNYDTGEDTGADISVVYSGGTLSSYGFMTDLNAAGGDALIFNDVMTFSDRLAYTNNASVTGTITFSNLNPSDFYTVAMFINRGADKGNTSVTLLDTDASASAHSPGVSVVSDLTAEINSDNTAAGYLVKWTDIVPLADEGTAFSVEISVSSGYMYMPLAIMIKENTGN